MTNDSPGEAQPTQPVSPSWGPPTEPAPSAHPTQPHYAQPTQPYQQGAWQPQGYPQPPGAWGQSQQQGPWGPPQPPGWPAPPRPPAPAPANYPQPARIELLADTRAYGLAILPPPVATSGVSIGSMTAGIGSLLVASVVWCFGFLGAEEGWGGLVSGAFCVLAVVLGIGAVGLGWAGLRQVRRGVVSRGRGYAITGIICGGAGILLAIAGVVIAVVMGQTGAATT